MGNSINSEDVCKVAAKLDAVSRMAEYGTHVPDPKADNHFFSGLSVLLDGIALELWDMAERKPEDLATAG